MRQGAEMVRRTSPVIGRPIVMATVGAQAGDTADQAWLCIGRLTSVSVGPIV